jgi:hypothetical protein
MSPAYSAFVFLFNSGHDDALIKLCGFDHATLRLLLGLFEPYYERYVFCSRTDLLREARVTKSGKKFGGRETSLQLCSLDRFWLGPGQEAL